MDEFWSKVDKSGDCWIWTKGKDDFGYGQLKFEGKTVKAHRVAYYLIHGRWPNHTRHTCDNPPCVNPEHLLDGTQLDNVADMISRDRHNWSVPNEVAIEIRNMVYDDTVLWRAVEKYGLSIDTTRNILTGNTYKHIVPAGRAIPRQRTRKRLSQVEVENIKEQLSNPYWGQQSILAKEYGVSRNMIQRIQYGTYTSSI